MNVCVSLCMMYVFSSCALTQTRLTFATDSATAIVSAHDRAQRSLSTCARSFLIQTHRDGGLGGGTGRNRGRGITERLMEPR